MVPDSRPVEASLVNLVSLIRLISLVALAVLLEVILGMSSEAGRYPRPYITFALFEWLIKGAVAFFDRKFEISVQHLQ